MRLAWLYASLARWRARYHYRDRRWRHWRQRTRTYPIEIAKWEQLRRQAIDHINLRKRQIAQHRPPATITMYDSVDLAQIPPIAHALAGYADGNYQTIEELIRLWPHAHHLSIAVFAAHDADCLDIENGDATPGQAPRWVRRQHARRQPRPCLYANLSTMPLVRAALANDNIPRDQYRLWVADYTNQPHIPPGYDGCQWTDKALDRNLDQSLLSGDFFN